MKYIVTYPLAAIVDQSADSSRLGQEVAISSDTVLKQVRSDAVYTFFKKYPETDTAIYRAAHEVFAACTKFTSGDDEVPAVSVAEQLSGLFDACAANDPEFEEEVPQASEGQAGLIIEPVDVEPHTLVDAIKKLHALNIAGKTDVYLLVYTDGSIAIHDGAEGDRPVVNAICYDDEYDIWKAGDIDGSVQRFVDFIMDERFEEWIVGFTSKGMRDVRPVYGTPMYLLG